MISCLCVFHNHVLECLNIYLYLHEIHWADTYKILLDFAIWDNQRKFLSLSRINVKKLLLLFYNLIEQKELAGGISSSDIINEYIIDRDLIVFPPFSIDLTHIPTREGDRLSFKENISNSLNDFKRTYPIMYPLRTLLSVSILCIPPRIQGIDLDNLARYIITLVNDILKPLSYYQFTIYIDNIKTIYPFFVKVTILLFFASVKSLLRLTDNIIEKITHIICFLNLS